MKELGEYLKQTRIDNGVGLDEASEDLNIDRDELENMEEGNVRAFKDMLELRRRMKEYAKYLGLDSDTVADEFNDFLFEHTSKISLSDILEAEQKREKEEKKITSPYTNIRSKEFDYKKLFIVIMCVLLAILLILVIRKITDPKMPTRTVELLNKKVVEVLV